MTAKYLHKPTAERMRIAEVLPEPLADFGSPAWERQHPCIYPRTKRNQRADEEDLRLRGGSAFTPGAVKPVTG